MKNEPNINMKNKKLATKEKKNKTKKTTKITPIDKTDKKYEGRKETRDQKKKHQK